MIQREISRMNEDFLSNIDLRSCLTLQVELLHSNHHLKNTDMLHMLKYAKAFGSTIKDTMKRVCRWSVYYYTSSSSYYAVPSNQIAFSDIPRLDPLPTVHIEKRSKGTNERIECFFFKYIW